MGKRKKNYSLLIKDRKKKKFFTLIKYLRISPRKIRLIVNLIKNKNIIETINFLKNYKSYKKSKILLNVIFLGISNYKNKTGLNNIKNLYIKNIEVNSSGMMKRIKYVSQGRVNIIRKKLSFIKLEIINKK
ncbi:MAG: uL22 family ribosomal protein [Candidatus Shikimatogenerans bostrichidophilus]|nr:MAG: uL22 family ribosomal protein [Candidatus Shikimatogenerans bostrichidophilus]